jgi:hypothetical protein
MPETLFISHNTDDDPTVTAIHNALEDRTDLEVWVDHIDNSAGTNFDTAVQAALHACDRGLIALSHKSIASHFCRSEWLVMIDRKIPFFVVLLEAIPPEKFPWYLKGILYVDYAADAANALQAIVDAITAPGAAPAAAAARRITEVSIAGKSLSPLLKIPLLGRDAALHKTQDALDTAGLVSITGVGGVGKSRLAAEALHTAPGDYAGGFWYVCTPGPADLIYTALRQDHFRLEANPTRPDREVVLAQLQAEKTLIVLDNGESVLPDREHRYAQVAQNLRDAGAGVLITSRVGWQKLGLAAQTVNLGQYPIPPEDAARMARRMADLRGVSPDDLPDDALPDFVKAARHHPRLIEWAVKRLGKATLDRVMRELDALKSRRTQDALYEMIGQTLDQMTAQVGDACRATLTALAACAGGFTFEAGTAVAALDEDDLDDALDVLVDWSFVTRDGARYAVDAMARESADPGRGRP